MWGGGGTGPRRYGRRIEAAGDHLRVAQTRLFRGRREEGSGRKFPARDGRSRRGGQEGASLGREAVIREDKSDEVAVKKQNENIHEATRRDTKVSSFPSCFFVWLRGCFSEEKIYAPHENSSLDCRHNSLCFLYDSS